MATASWFAGVKRRVMLRVCAALVLVFSLFAVAPRQAYAGYEWCSVDPVISLQRAGGLLPQLVDVQVLVPIWAVPVAEVATLTVDLPAGIQGTEIFNGSTPLLQVKTSFQGPGSTADRNRVDLTLKVPRADKDFPVRLLVTDPSSGAVTMTEGWAGHKVRTTVEVVP